MPMCEATREKRTENGNVPDSATDVPVIQVVSWRVHRGIGELKRSTARGWGAARKGDLVLAAPKDHDPLSFSKATGK